MELSSNKIKSMIKLSNENNIFAALAFDQRGALKKMISKYQEKEVTFYQIEEIKKIVTEELTQYTSAILLDPEYGISASKVKYKDSGLMMAYEKTGYDTKSTKRFPDCLDLWSVKRLKRYGADAIKFLIYYDIDSDYETNKRKQAYIERIGAECKSEDIPFFLEILSYDEKIIDNKSEEYARLKPRKVNEAMKVFSDPRFGVDVLKVEVPVNMEYVEGYTKKAIIYTKGEAEKYFREQNESTNLPYIYLSAGVSAEMFNETLKFAHESGANFNGVLCGRASGAGVIKVYIENGAEKAREWLRTIGLNNILELNKTISKYAKPWKDKY